MTVSLIVVAVVLILLAGVFAAADAALMSISRARVDAVVRARRAGAKALAAVVAARPRHVNLLLLLRLTAETAAPGCWRSRSRPRSRRAGSACCSPA